MPFAQSFELQGVPETPEDPNHKALHDPKAKIPEPSCPGSTKGTIVINPITGTLKDILLETLGGTLAGTLIIKTKGARRELSRRGLFSGAGCTTFRVTSQLQNGGFEAYPV